MKQVKVNNNRVWEVEATLLNGIPFPVEMVATGDRFYHLLYEGQSFEVELIDHEEQQKTMRLRVNGHIYDISLKTEMDMMLEAMGLNSATVGKMKNLKAPMPGLVIDLRVVSGDSVQKGDPVIVLEAMKMENVLKAEGEGVVKNILVQKGQNVEKGLVMIEFE